MDKHTYVLYKYIIIWNYYRYHSHKNPARILPQMVFLCVSWYALRLQFEGPHCEATFAAREPQRWEQRCSLTTQGRGGVQQHVITKQEVQKIPKRSKKTSNISKVHT